MAGHTDEIAVVRERIIELARIWDEESIEPAEDFADAVLDALGLEHFGWVDHRPEPHFFRSGNPELDAACIADGDTPVYRLRALSDSREAPDGR